MRTTLLDAPAKLELVHGGANRLGGLGHEGPALVNPLERFRHRLIEVRDKCQDLGFQIFDGGNVATFEQFPDQDLNQISIWFIQDACLGV